MTGSASHSYGTCYRDRLLQSANQVWHTHIAMSPSSSVRGRGEWIQGGEACIFYTISSSGTTTVLFRIQLATLSTLSGSLFAPTASRAEAFNFSDRR